MFRKNTIKCFAFLFLSLCMAFSFKTDACESAAITGETSLAGMTVYLDRFYSASVKRRQMIEKNRLRQKRITGRKLKRNQTYMIHWQMRDLSMKILVLQMCQGR